MKDLNLIRCLIDMADKLLVSNGQLVFLLPVKLEK